MLKKTILILILISTILTVGLVYLNEVLLPTKLKDILIKKITQEIGREILISDLRYVPLKGLVITELTVFEKNQKKEPFLSVKEASISILYIPALMSKKVNIPSLVIKNPIIRITKHRTNEWNFSDLLSLKKTNNEKSQITAYIGGLKIINGTFIFSDKNLFKEPIEIIENINLSANLALPKGARADIRIMPSAKNPLKLISSINCQFDSGDFLSTLNVENFSLKKLAPYIKTSNLHLKDSSVSIAALDISRRNKKTTAKGKASLGKTHLATENETHFSSTPSISIDELTIENGILSCLGNLYLHKSVIIDDKNKIEGTISYNFNLKKKGQMIDSSGDLTIENLKGKFNAKTLSSKNVKGKAELKYNGKILESFLDMQAQNTVIEFPDKTQFSGNPALKANITFNSISRKTPLKYSGSITTSSALLTHLPYLKNAQNIKGILNFENNKISSPEIFTLIKNTPLKLSGELTNFQKPILSIQGEIPNVDLSNFKDIFKEIQNDPTSDIKGQASIAFKYKGAAKSIDNSTISISSSLKNAAIKTKILPSEVVNISGDISYAVDSLSQTHFLPDNATWKNLKGTFQERQYISDGSLAFNSLLARIIVDGLEADANVKLMLDRFKINSLKIKYEDTDLVTQGEILYPKGDELNINVDIDGNLRLEHLSKFIKPFKEKFKNINPQGLCSIKSSFTGDPKYWKDWALFLKVKSNKIFLKNYELNNLSLKINQRDRYISECSASALFYDGKLTADASVDLSIEEIPYKIESNIQNLNLEKLKNATPLRDKDISGLLQATYQGSGPLSDIHFSKGAGSIAINQGELWHLDLLKGLGKLLFVPEYKNITFDHAKSDFVITNEKVFIKDGILKSNQMQLACNGTISFKGDLDLDIISRFEQNIMKIQSLKKTIAAILTQANDFLTVKITGTWKEPKYYIVPSTHGMIQKTKNFILDGLPNIF